MQYEFETSKINSHDWLLSWSPKMFTKAVCDVCNLAPCGELWRSKMETLKTCRWTRWTLDEDGAFRGISMDLDGSRRISTDLDGSRRISTDLDGSRRISTDLDFRIQSRWTHLVPTHFVTEAKISPEICVQLVKLQFEIDNPKTK